MSTTVQYLHLNFTKKKGTPVVRVGPHTFSLGADKQNVQYLRLMEAIVGAAYWIWWSGGDLRDPTVIVRVAVDRHNEHFPDLSVTAEDVIVTTPGEERLKLSRRRREVVELIAAGLTNVEIATRLYITPHTVEQHVTFLLRTAMVSNRHELATWYKNDGGSPDSGQARP